MLLRTLWKAAQPPPLCHNLPSGTLNSSRQSRNDRRRGLTNSFPVPDRCQHTFDPHTLNRRREPESIYPTKGDGSPFFLSFYEVFTPIERKWGESVFQSKANCDLLRPLIYFSPANSFHNRRKWIWNSSKGVNTSNPRHSTLYIYFLICARRCPGVNLRTF